MRNLDLHIHPSSIFLYIINPHLDCITYPSLDIRSIIFIKLFIIYSIGSFAIYNLLSLIDYIFIFSPQNKIHIKRETIYKEIKLNFYDCIFSSILYIPWIYVGHMTKYSKIFYTLTDYTLFAQLFFILLFVCVSELFIYWIHRFLHVFPWLYKNIHKPHHEFIHVDPFVAGAFHPLDAFLQGLPYFALPLFVPIYHYFIIVSLFLVICWSVSIHDRRAIANWNLLNGAAHHDIHHTKFNYNYGQVFTVCDRIFNTYYHPIP